MWAWDPSQRLTAAIRPGTFARIHGLQQQPQLNGEVAEVLSPAANGRWLVATRQGEKSLKPDNLLAEVIQVSPFIWRFIRISSTFTAFAVGNAGRTRGRHGPSAAMIPALAMLWLLGTLGMCFKLSAPLRASAWSVPAISEMGIAPPARGAYRAGFTVVGILFAMTVWLYNSLLMSQLSEAAPSDDLGMPWSSTRYGFLAAFGVLLQGLLTLEPRLSWMSGLHFLGAIFFVVGTMQHATMSNALFASARGEALLRTGMASHAFWFRNICTEKGPAALMALPIFQQMAARIPSLFRGASAGASGAAGSGLEGAMGLAQWALVLNFAAYFCSYGLDFVAAGGAAGGGVPESAARP